MYFNINNNILYIIIITNQQQQYSHLVEDSCQHNGLQSPPSLDEWAILHKYGVH